ncbi:L-aspartate oxidase [Rarobacter faecitabidus]|uniref:L-aspartate oxidase n=1 Tax=Rarobacter faecitabidus TaxID=13243 RepID=A0A542ZTU2_RARFA|nr:L-aspartate oxidase [Rarobacter faecitabidus]TQL63686.1 L-aspartate oxidase [Rarobacter faecitabidus]
MSAPALGGLGAAPNVPRLLAGPRPGWSTTADVVVIGSGVAGMTAALDLCGKVGKVVLLTKTVLTSGSTVWAQGGVAAALDPADTAEAHLADTLVAGGGLCDEGAVEILVSEGPAAVRQLIDRGARFDQSDQGEILLGLEGGHHASRIAHAGGDATGAEISRALAAQIDEVLQHPGIEVIEHAQMIDLLTDEAGKVCGVTLHVVGAGTRDGVGAVHSRAVVLATGGIGELFTSSTNPPQASADGLSAALRAGAHLADLEFVQFHPTVLWLGAGARGQLTLISEAVRGEGAHLLDVEGTRFMKDIHPLAELAPRDVVAHAIVRQLAKTGSDHVLLDARHLGPEFLAARFPTITRRLLDAGFEFGHDLIPVAPAQHFHSGGVLTDTNGRSSVDGLYAVGECACSGVHGANRLASNSLLEGLVFGRRAAADIVRRIEAGDLPYSQPDGPRAPAGLVAGAARSRIQRVMTAGTGVVRDEASLRSALMALGNVPVDAHEREDLQALPQYAEWETSNIHAAAVATTLAALLRTESRGGHFRSDFPAPSESQVARTVISLGDNGVLRTRVAPIRSTLAAVLSATTEMGNR